MNTDTLAAVRARHARAEQDKQPLWAQTHADRALLLAEIDRLRECLEPGKASAIVAGMFEVAIRHGHSPYSSKHALTFLDKEILRLRARVAEVEGECGRLRAERERFEHIEAALENAEAAVARLTAAEGEYEKLRARLHERSDA